jgi:hypothetical protein
MKKIHLNFCGKDSVIYDRDIEVPDEIYDEFKKLYDAAGNGEEIFDKISSADVSAFLNEVHPGISPKVLRTAKCNKVLVDELKKQDVDENSTTSEKIRAMYHANLQIAKTLNHQKNVAKNQKEQEKKAEEKVENSQTKLEELKKKQEEKLEKLDAEEKRIKENYKNMPSIKKDKLAALKEKREKLKIQLAKANERIEKAKFNLTKRQETKDINLGTSLGAYADYRIIYSWCNDMKLDPKNIYSKGLRDKSAVFSGTDKDFWKTI